MVIEIKQNILRMTIIFLFGGILYSLTEILFRGYTHWSMTLTGGICFLIIYIRFTEKADESLLMKCFYSALVITVAEFVTGCVLNLWLKWGIWDYSGHSLNICGQICPLFTAMWFAIGVPANWLCGALSKHTSGAMAGKPPRAVAGKPPRAVSPQCKLRAVVTRISPSRGNIEKEKNSQSTNGSSAVALVSPGETWSRHSAKSL